MLGESLENYQFFWRKKKAVVLPIRLAALLLAGWICILSLLSLFHLFQYWRWKGQEQQVQQTIDLLIKKYNQAQVAFLAVLGEKDAIYHTGPTPYLAYLGSFQSAGTWLTQITVDLKTGVIQLVGHALTSSGVDDFLGHLKQSSSPFIDWKIVSAQLTRSATAASTTASLVNTVEMQDAATKRYYDFSLRVESSWYVPPKEPEKK